MKRRKRHLSPEEKELWRFAVRDVQPLEKTLPLDFEAQAEEKPIPNQPAAKLKKPVERRVSLEDVVPSRLKGALGAAPSPLVGAAPNRQWDRTLKRGAVEIDARLDLHGQTEAQAYRRLVRFVVEAAALDARKLLVITGKGHKGQGLLKNRLPAWLTEGDLRPLVMAVHPAHIKDGGDGAFYVILRRRRP